MQSTNSEYGSPYLAVCHVTFTVQKGAVRFFFLGNLYIFFIQQGCIILTKSD